VCAQWAIKSDFFFEVMLTFVYSYCSSEYSLRNYYDLIHLALTKYARSFKVMVLFGGT